MFNKQPLTGNETVAKRRSENTVESPQNTIRYEQADIHAEDKLPRYRQQGSEDVILAEVQKYVPRALVDQVAATLLDFGNSSGSISSDIWTENEEFEAAVLFADVSGFTALGEHLAARPDVLARTIDNILEQMVAIVVSLGGDIIKFCGDAILAVFRSYDFNGNSNLACVACIYAAAQLVKIDINLDDKPEIGSGWKLTMHCASSFGTIVSKTFGSPKTLRKEYVITGEPVSEIENLENFASPGAIILSAGMNQICCTEVEVEEIKEFGCAFRFISFLHDPSFKMEGSMAVNKISSISNLVDRELLISELKRYIPRPALTSQAQMINITALVTSVFIRFNLDFGVATNKETMRESSTCIRLSFEIVHYYNGTVMRFDIGDKGAVMFCCFGLPTNSQVDIITRALIAVRDIRSKAVSNSHEIDIGVTTGTVFLGPIGGPTRCEYTIHGSVVNRSAKFMVKAKGKTLCCEATKHQATKYNLKQLFSCFLKRKNGNGLGKFAFGKPELLVVKGIKQPVRAYPLLV